MSSLHINIEDIEWESAIPFYGQGVVHEGKEIIQLKVLCDRRNEGGGITWIVKFIPPLGKLIKIIAVALSDEHVLVLEGKRSTQSGSLSKVPSGYNLNPKGQAHSAIITSLMTAFVVYVGEPDEVRLIEVMDIVTS